MPANHAPVTQSATVSAAADTPYVFQLGDFAFDDSADAPSPNTLANVVIRTLPSPGVLMFDADGAGGNTAIEVAVGQVISAAEIAAGHLTFTPGEFATGNNYASFQFQVQDDGAGPALYQTGPFPRSVLAIDVNHDSKLDLVYVSDATSAGQIGVRLGAGDGTFGAESRVAVGDTPAALIAVNLDGDTNPDLVVTNYVGGTVQVLKGNADGTFQSPVTVDTVQSVSAIAGDFNHDGFADLAIADREHSEVRILLGDGSGTGFTTAVYDNGSNGSVTTMVATADFNEDGNMDLVFANEVDQFNSPFSGNVTLVLGNADGTFQGPQNVATGLRYPYAVKTADFNGDGHADLAYTLIDTPGAVVVKLGNGDGSFEAAETIDLATPASDVAVADIDGDGKLDLIATDYQPDGSLLVLRGNGDGTFQSAVHIPTASYPFSIGTGDLNSDGKIDLITTNYIANNLSVLLNGDTLLDGNANTSDLAIINIDIAGSNHEPTADAGGPYTVQAGDSLQLAGSGSDVDNDTLTYSWDLNDDTVFGDAVGATPTLTTSQLQALGITSGSYTISLRVSDGQDGETTNLSTLYFNNAPTANADSVATTEDTPITIDGATLFGNDIDADSGTTFSITGVSDAQGGSVTLNGGNPIFTPDANFNGPASFVYQVSDGHGGTATATATVDIAAVNDAPVTQSATVSTDEDTAYVFQLADFDFTDPSDQSDPDSFANVVIRTLPGSGALMFDADGAGGNAAVEVKIGQVISTADITAGHLSYVPGADGNGDGYASFDFVVQDDGAGLALYQTGPFPRSVLAIDVNHDSKLDLVYVSEYSADGKIGVRLGAGDGTFGSESAIAVGNGPSALLAVNLDGDSNPDLVVTNYITGNVQVLKGNANGTFQSPVTIDTVQSVAAVAGDFNHDGFADLAIADREHSEVRILLGDGTGTGFTTAVYDNGSNGSVTTSVATADFNEDGNMDLVFASENDQFNNLNTGNVTLVLGNADGTFQAPQDVATGLGHTYAVKTADFNGDDHADLVYTLIDSPGAVVVRLGVGDGTFEAPETIALAAPAIDVAVVDVDGDGELDLIVTDYQPAGSLSVLRGNGDGTFQSAVHVPVASNPFSIGAGDFNGDGKIDLITTNYIANNLSVLLNSSTLLNGDANISDPATITIDVAAVNDAPVNTIAAQTATEDTDSPITGLSVDDVDIGSGLITVTLTVQHGTIHVAADVPGGLDSFDITNNDTSSVTLSCDPALVNATLASGITYRPGANFNGTDTLTMLSDDGANGGTATDGAKTDSDTVDIAVAAANDAPVNTIAAQTATEDTDSAITGLSISDIDIGGGSITVSLFVDNGTIHVRSDVAGGVVASGISDNDTSGVTLTGDLAHVNATLAAINGIVYRSGLDFNGTDHLEMVSGDHGNTGIGGNKTDDDTVAITVAAVNDAPVNTVPAGPLATPNNTNLVISGLAVDDIDATALTTVLHADHGTLTVAGGGAGVSGSGTATVTLSGTAAQINATLAAANSVVYRSAVGFTGTDTLTVTSNDGGGTGTGGPKTDVDPVSIDVGVPGGANVFVGGPGDDPYTIDNPNDQIIESANAGNDTANASVSYVLPDNVENLILLGGANLEGKGNVLANNIAGNSGNNVIDGGAGADILTGNAGDDRFVFSPGAGADTITDFTAGAGPGDKMVLTAFPGLHTLNDVLALTTQQGADAVINFGNGDTITLQNVQKTALNADDFVLEFFAQPATGLAASFNPANGWTSQDQFPRHLADVNGDGSADIVGFGNGGVYVSLGNGDGSFAPLSIKLAAFNPGNGWTSDNSFHRELADVNGDGMADIVGFGNGGVYVSLATGGGNFAPLSITLAAFNPANGWTSQDQFPRELADVNGDGMSDIVAFGNGGVYVSLATGGGNFAPLSIKLAALNPGNGWTSNDQFPRELADVNGDGMADIVGFGNGGAYVALATGGGNFATPFIGVAALNPGNGWTTQHQFPRELADVNHDGMADIVGFGNGGVYVAVATGGGHFATPIIDISAFNPANGWTGNDQFPRQLADVNHDGFADIVGYGNPGVLVALGNDFHLI